MRPASKIQSNNSNPLNLIMGRTANHIQSLKLFHPVKSTRHAKFTLRATRNTTISSMIRLRLTIMAILSLQWLHILARVRLFLPLLQHGCTITATSHLRNGPCKWSQARSPPYGPAPPVALSGLRTRILVVIFVADRTVLAHTMARWTFPRWISMSSASNSRGKCGSMRLIMVALFPIQLCQILSLPFVNSISRASVQPLGILQTSNVLVGGVMAYRIQRGA